MVTPLPPLSWPRTLNGAYFNNYGTVTESTNRAMFKTSKERDRGAPMVPENVKAAMKRYYMNRKRSRESVIGCNWDKDADLEHIKKSLPENCSGFQASAGTFWFAWRKEGIQTVHSERNYWCNKVASRRMPGKNGEKPKWVSTGGFLG